MSMRKYFIGPMPVRNFLDKFLPVRPPSIRKSKLLGFEVMAGLNLESQVDTFTQVANSVRSGIRASSTPQDHHSYDSENVSKYRPKIAFYDANTSNPKNPLVSFQRMEMFVEFKPDDPFDPFHSDDPSSFGGLYEQTNLCSARLQTYQFRTWAFSVGIFGNVARLFRWDRAGAIVSEPIPYCEKGNGDLVEFLRRFDVMDRSQRGWDPTVFDATLEETMAFDMAIRAHGMEERNALLKPLLESAGKKDRYPRKRVEIPICDDKGERTMSYVVGRSIANVGSPMGRATRGFVAMSKDSGKLVFLKDSWRPDSADTKGEWDLFKKAEGARNISAFLHGSDIKYAVNTLTNSYLKEFGWEWDLTGFIHYRAVQSEFYVPLYMFKDSRELTQIMHDIITAIQDLHERGILHRDISTGNIMISVDGRGRLIDLDLALDRNEVDTQRFFRIGTWQFMSTRLLSHPGKVHELCDDLESLWFVLLFEGLHFVKHNSPRDIDMPLIFDQVFVPPTTGIPIGGVGKGLLYATMRPTMGWNLEFESKPFTFLIRQIYQLFRSLNAYYMAKDMDEPVSVLHEENVGKLKGCVEIERLLTEALDSDDWPDVSDKIEDQYPPVGHRALKHMGGVTLSFVNRSFQPSGKPLKRKREGDDDPQAPETKRPKMDLPLLKRIWSKCATLARGRPSPVP